MNNSNYYLDTEFIEDGQTIDLISIGIVCDDGREYYAEVDDVPWGKADPWVWKNVKPQLLGSGWIRSKAQIADEIVAFVKDGKGKPRFVGYYVDYDWVVFCRLYGRMIDLPKGWPMFCLDIKQMAESYGNPKLPAQEAGEHHALADARWNQKAHNYLRSNFMIGSYEWCVMMKDFDSPHRGPWSEEMCNNWVQDQVDDGVKPGAFYVAKRWCGEWMPEGEE